MTQLRDLAAEYLDLKARADEIGDRLAQITAQLRDLGPGSHAADGIATIGVSQAKRFDPALAAELLTADQLHACSETVVTSARAKQVLAPALYEMCSAANGQPRVTVKAL